MAKAKFDRSEVVEAATELFWRKGYNCSSMQEVFRVTGLQPGSLYNAFGNKEGLFEESVRFYGNRTADWFRESFASQPDKLEAVTQLFVDLIDFTDSPDYNGCLLVKSALELQSMDNQRLLQLVNDQIKVQEDIFADALQENFDQTTARRKAAALIMSKAGLVVQAITGATKDALINDLRLMFDWLPWEKVLSSQPEAQSVSPLEQPALLATAPD